MRDRGELSWHYVTELLERRQHDLVRHLAELEQLNAQLAKLVGIAATGTPSHSPGGYCQILERMDPLLPRVTMRHP